MLARRHCRPSRAKKSSASFAAPVFSARRRVLQQLEVRGCFHIRHWNRNWLPVFFAQRR
jgi:hypothetical protein